MYCVGGSYCLSSTCLRRLPPPLLSEYSCPVLEAVASGAGRNFRISTSSLWCHSLTAKYVISSGDPPCPVIACQQVRLMQPMAAGVRRSLNPGPQHATTAHAAPAHRAPGVPLAALTPEEDTPPLRRREFGAEGLRESTMNDSDGTPAEVRAGSLHSRYHINCSGRQFLDGDPPRVLLS